jgi:hypothetical protein
MKIIHVRATGFGYAFKAAKAGYVSRLLIHGVQYSPELRNNPPRIKLLLDNVVGQFMPCELLDDWPEAPEFWPVPDKPPEPREIAEASP